MAETGYYDSYPGMEHGTGMMPPMAGFRGQTAENYHDPDHKPPPYYSAADAYTSLHMPVTSAGVTPGLDSAAASDYAMATASMAQAASHIGGMYDPSVAYPIKTENSRRMPPTPPGSPEDTKDLSLGMHHGLPHTLATSMASSLALAKPVAMRRLSERSIGHTRPGLGPVPVGADPLSDSMYGPSSAIARAVALTHQTQRRPRSEKKPIPDEAKDGKYFERRKRNNLAAKKSRDSRKSREDDIAIRASFLEKENAILRAQVATLREEANSLRQLLLQKKSKPSAQPSQQVMPPMPWGDMHKS